MHGGIGSNGIDTDTSIGMVGGLQTDCQNTQPSPGKAMYWAMSREGGEGGVHAG